MDLEFFSQSLAEICAHSLVSPGRSLRPVVIANPKAGGFTIHSRWNEHLKTLHEYRQKAALNPLRKIYGGSDLILTDGKGSAEKITLSLIKEAEKDPAPFYLIITAGGDGTSLEVLSGMYNAPAHIRSNFAVLRLPMGTGNDSADSIHLAGALDLLINPAHVKFAPALRLVTAPGGAACKKGSGLAFNILSVGLDAYVTHMANIMKGKFPGNSYKLWVDIAAIFYDRVYKVDYIDVRLLDQQNREIRSFREKLLLLAMGVSGMRTYGAGKKILPDEHNVCAIKQTSLFGKIAIKKLVVSGMHTSHKDAMFLNAHRVEFSGSSPILVQMDGETMLLQPEDFPAAIELTAPVIPLLCAS
ncbi:MAG: diacylglycerol kinase [Treponema sp.]|nr:diacylglycerol kinase [Treponema sp.]